MGGLGLKEASGLFTMLNKSGGILCDPVHQSPSFRRYLSTNAVVGRIKSMHIAAEGNWESYCCSKQRILEAGDAKESKERLEDGFEGVLKVSESVIFNTTK